MTSHAKRLPVKIFTAADGLGSSFVNFITRDSRGFMWFCTRDGLSRFDGSQFVTYQIGGASAHPGIENIYETRDGIYWITTTGGLFRYDPNRISPDTAGDRLLDAERISGHRGDLYQDRSGNFWLGSTGLFQIVFEEGKYTLRPFALAIPTREGIEFNIADLDESNDGSLWINASWGIIRLLPDRRIVYYPDELKTQTTSGSLRMIVDKNGRVWLARDNRIYVLKPEPVESLSNEKLTISPLVPTDVIAARPNEAVRMPKLGGEIYQVTNPDVIDRLFAKQPFQSSDGDVWITAEHNLLHFSESGFKVYNVAEGLPNVMARISEDNVGNIWIASRNGAARLDRRGLFSFGLEDGAASDRFQTIIEGADGSMVFGNPYAELSRFDGIRFTTAKPAVPGNTAHIWTSRNAFLDSRGDWWLLTTDGLHRFSGVSDFAQLNRRAPTASYGVDTGLKSDGMFQIFEDTSGDIWVSTRGSDISGHGLARLRVGEPSFVTFNEENGFPSGRSTSSFAEDRNGNLWVGFYEGGAARFDGERFLVFGPDDGLPSDSVLSDLHLDSKGRMWLTSASAGVFRVDDPGSPDPEFVKLDTSNGLSSNNVRTVTEDRFGRLYFGSARGIDRLTPDTGRFKHYTTIDGLAADFVSDSFCDSRGDLWFATDNGVSRLSPFPDERSAPPQIWLQGLRIAGETQPTLEMGSTLVETSDLSDSQNNLQIDFFGIDFRASESLKYQYKLEGANADWSEPSENRTVTFANLRPGGYRFLVRAVNSDGTVSENPAVVSFTILSPLWARWWMITLAALAVGLSFVTLYRYRLHRLQEVNAALREAKRAEERLRRSREERIAELERVRARIATDLHDDIGASLTQIAILSEVAQARANGNATLNEPLEKITDVSNELVGTMSDIVWSINPAKDHISDLAQRMRRFSSDLFASRNINLQFLAPAGDDSTVLGSSVRREIFLLFKETVNNVVKHSGASSVRIELAVENAELSLRISDDGVGFDPTNVPPTDGGHGLKGMRRRVAEFDGRFQVLSEPGAGTTVSIAVPLTEQPA